MRELKFRAWNETEKEMVYWEGFGEIDDDYCYAGEHPIYDLSEVPVMQYTGLKDKNGKEIYEGDITNEGVVEWNNELNWDSGGSPHPGFYFKNQYDMGDYGALDYHIGFDEYIEVIGNIWENKELLNGI